MRSHVLDVGPNAVRRLCCGGATIADLELQRSAFECIDDELALVDSRPVSVVSLWRDVFESLDCGAADGVTVVHPSWWPSPRVDVVTTAATAALDGVRVRTRSLLLGPAGPIVEIATDFVVVLGATTSVETRRGEQSAVVDTVVRTVLAMAADTVVVDAPAAVRGAGALAVAIAKAMPGVAVVIVDDLRFRKIAAELAPGMDSHRPPAVRARWAWAVLVLLVVLSVGAVARRHHAQPPRFPTTIAVEGLVAVEVPAAWAMRRVIGGPGSARLQFTSPTDPEVALHVTQSRVALPGLDATADFLKRAIDEAPDRVFVDFNPADHGAGRPVVTYREVRAGHDIRWTVWVDTAVRISVGCQSRSGHTEAVDEACDLAIRTAHAVD